MGQKIMKHLFTFIAAACFAAAAVFGWKIYQKEMEYRKGQEVLEEIYSVMESVETELPEPAQGSAPNTEELERQKRLAQYTALHEQNADMMGWIRIEGTQIDYPVMYTPEDPEYYLYRNFKKEKSSYGMIFIDGDCRLDGTSPNILIYGHHMRNGSMFAEIENYDSREFWENHPYIEFDTLEEPGTYQVIGAFKQPANRVDEDFMTMLLAQTEEDYEELIRFVKGYRFYDTQLEAEYPEELITLATCEYTQTDGRFFVVAKKVESK